METCKVSQNRQRQTSIQDFYIIHSLLLALLGVLTPLAKVYLKIGPVWKTPNQIVAVQGYYPSCASVKLQHLRNQMSGAVQYLHCGTGNLQESLLKVWCGHIVQLCYACAGLTWLLSRSPTPTCPLEHMGCAQRRLQSRLIVLTTLSLNSGEKQNFVGYITHTDVESSCAQLVKPCVKMV